MCQPSASTAIELNHQPPAISTTILVRSGTPDGVPFSNQGGYANAELDALIDKAAETVDTAARTAKRGDRTLELSAREYALLEYLIRNAGPRPAGLLLLSGTPALCEASWFKASEPAALLAEITAREEALGLRVAAPEHEDDGALALGHRARILVAIASPEREAGERHHVPEPV